MTVWDFGCIEALCVVDGLYYQGRTCIQEGAEKI